MDVYLDAVFYPRIYFTPEIMQQEGWHYEIEKPEDDLKFSGVVYSEMKGALSSPDDILASKILRSMFPDTTYQHESGGDPEFIPQLTQKQFLDFHHRYYHPSNSYIYLYGDFDLEEKLKYIDQEYLSRFDRLEIDSTIKTQKPFDAMKRIDDFYPIGEDESTESKTFLSMNYVIGSALDRKKIAALSLINHAIFESPAAPIRKALIDAGICKDVSTMFETDVMQPVFGIILNGSELKHVEKFQSILEEQLKSIVKNGIDRKLLTAALNSWEFLLRESDFGTTPRGLIYNIRALSTSLYEGDAFEALSYEDLLESVKSELNTRYFESLLESCFLNNTHSALITLSPSKTFAAERDRRVATKLQAVKNSMSADEIEQLIQKTRKLKEFQAREDSPEALATIPILQRSDLRRDCEHFPFEKISDNLFLSELPTHEILYSNMYFDAEKIPKDKLFYAHLLTSLLGYVDTRQHSYEDISTMIATELGGLQFSINALDDPKIRNSTIPHFRVVSKVLSSKKTKMLEIVREILTESVFTNKTRIRELVEQEKISFELNLQATSQSMVIGRILSRLSKAARYSFQSSLPYYRFICELVENFDSRFDSLTHELDETLKIMSNRNDLVIHATAEKSTFEEFEKDLPILIDALPAEKIPKQSYDFELPQHNEGFSSQSQIQHVGKGANFFDLGFEYTGSMQVLSTILRYEYLWTRVRVLGGAYGANANFAANGNMYFSSYRDPNLKETLTIFDGTADFIRELDLSPREVDKYIIGTLSTSDMPLTPRMKGELMLVMHFRNISYEDRQKMRDEVLKTQLDDIHKLADVVEACMKQNIYCVFGNDDKIRSEKDLFDEIIPVLV